MHCKLGFLVVIVGVQLISTLGQPQQPHPNQAYARPQAQPPQDEERVANPIPKVPLPPNCIQHGFPGSPSWNACFQRFEAEMQTFQNQMQIYKQRIMENNIKAVNSHNAKDASGPGGVKYTTSSSSQGYTIRTTGVPVSTMTRYSEVFIRLTVGKFNTFTTRVEGKEIILEITAKQGNKKYVAIKVPEGVQASDIQVERSSDSIMITGPTQASLAHSDGDEKPHHSSSSSVSEDGTSHSSSQSFSDGNGGTGFVKSFSFGSNGNPSASASIPEIPNYNQFNPFFGNQYNPYIPQAPMWFF